MKYQIKHRLFSAIQFTAESITEVLSFCPEIKKLEEPLETPDGTREYYFPTEGANLYINTGDWIVENDRGKFGRYSPEEFTEKFQSSTSNLTFSDALAALKKGHLIARDGWNGKGMFLVLIKPGQHGEDSLLLEYANPTHINCDDGPDEMKVDPVIAMKTAGNTLQLGWLASQADMLSEDWNVLD